MSKATVNLIRENEPVHYKCCFATWGMLRPLFIRGQSMHLSDNSNQGLDSVREKPLILAVDDHEDNLLLVSHVLLSFGCTFITTTNIEQSLSLVRDHLPNLILLEVFLQNGLELVHRLKEDQLTSKIPIIAVTVLASPKDRELILNAGCDDYLSKPYLLKDLENIILRNLQSKPVPAFTV